MKRFHLILAFAFALTLCVSAFGQDTSITYSFQNVNYPGDTFTQLLGINNAGLIAGYHNVNQNKGFTLNLPNRFTAENFPQSMMTQVIGVNNSGETSGFYVDPSNVTHGFYKNGTAYVGVNFPGSRFNQLLSQNDMGQAAGYYSLSLTNSTPDFPYIYDENGGEFEVITIPGAVGGAQATGINNTQQVCGFFIDQNQVNHGFLLSFGTFTRLDVPGSTFTQALGLNNRGQVVGVWSPDGGNTLHGWVWTRTAGFQTVDDPSGVGMTVVNGINDNGTLVGFFGTSPTNSGFVATPE
jgi:hypothetical protein